MRVDECCQAVLAQALPLIDKEREGVCIDVGVGRPPLYCELTARLGFQTVAVEPLPEDSLQQACSHYGIKLVESCLSDINGSQPLYLGTYHGGTDLNLSSLMPDWWGASTETRRVHSMTLSTLLSTINATKITYLKLDVEGIESKIIRQFLMLPESLLPSVVMFEYGGGGNRQSDKSGWSKKYLNATMECLSTLRKCGYGLTLVVDSAAATTERIFDLSSSFNLELDQIFDPHAVYGNMISFRDVSPPESEIRRICTGYYDNESPSRSIRNLLGNQLQKFFSRFYAVLKK